MSERRENSVLFSLKELRRIEDDRVKKEEAEVRARAEAEKAAKEAAVRRAREDEEQKRRDEEERVRRVAAEKEARQREEQLRLQEAEQRHRVEGELRIQEERMRLEAHARKASSPVKAVVSVAAVLIVVAGGLGYRMYSQHQAELAAAESVRARLEQEAKAARVELEQKILAIRNEMNTQLATAKSEEERVRIRAEANARTELAQRAIAAAAESARKHPKGGAKSDKDPTVGTTYKVKPKRDVSDNPLEGLKL